MYKNFYKKLGIRIVLLFLLLLFLFSGKAMGQDDYINIIFTHDLHDNIEGYDTIIDGEIVNIGGFERINHFIEKEKEIYQNTLVLDGGDYSMGSLFQTIQATDSPTLRLMGVMGYDALVIGNHEFDYGAKAYGRSLDAALKHGGRLPKIVATNLDYDLLDEDLKKSMNNYGISKSIIIEKNGIRIGIIGLLGRDAQYSILTEGIKFLNPIEAARKEVDSIKNQVDMIICLSHSGTWKNPKRSEDESLAREVGDIDLIISGHTHTILDKPIRYGKTLIVSTGKYAKHIGKILLKKDGDKISLKDYKIVLLDQKVEEAKLSGMINDFKRSVQANYLDVFGMEFEQVLAFSDFNFTPASNLATELKEEPLANLIADSFIYKVKEIEKKEYEEIAASVVTAGSIKGSFVKGEITCSDVFNVTSLGVGPDGLSVSPLISVYLKGKDLKTLAELDTSITKYMRVAQLFFSGLEYEYNPNRLLLNRVTKINLLDENNKPVAIDDNKLYRVIASLTSGQMLDLVGKTSKNIIKITPRNKEGLPIDRLEDYIIYENGQEVKEWKALADYLQSFDKIDGLAKIPKEYKQVQGRKVLNDSKDLIAILSRPNRYSLSIYGLLLLLLALLVLILKFIYNFIKKKIKLTNK